MECQLKLIGLGIQGYTVDPSWGLKSKTNLTMTLVSAEEKFSSRTIMHCGNSTSHAQAHDLEIPQMHII
jgi:hypothetical protein